MNALNRRDFLKWSGVSAAVASIVPGEMRALWGSPDAIKGRLFGTASVYTAPDHNAHIVTTLAPDSVHRVVSVRRGWVELPTGFIPETMIQPMLPTHYRQPDSLPAWLEVAAPYASLHAYCAADAPIVGRVEHGGVIYSPKSLTDSAGRVWYGLEDGGAIRAWAQAPHLQTADLPTAAPATQLVLEGFRLRVYQERREVARFRVSRPIDIGRGEYALAEKAPRFAAASWSSLWEGGFRLHGVGHHNTFGGYQAGQDVELPMIAAKYLYSMLTNDTLLTIL